MKTRCGLSTCKHHVIKRTCTECKPAPHTPTPGLVDLYDGASGYVGAQFFVERLGVSEVKAAYIVRAVNTHEELVKFLRLLVINGQISGNFLKEAERLIAKAEEK